MGLKKELKLDNDLYSKEAYFRIDTISGYKDKITISLNGYYSYETFSNGMDYLRQDLYSFIPDVSLDAKGIWTQAYEHLKSLEEFKDALDH